MNELQIINIDGVECYEENGVAYLKLESVARGLGFTQTQNKNGTDYTSIRWETINRYLDDIGFPNKLGKDDFIPENVFYRLAMKAKNETAEKFQAKVADEIIPSIRKTGGYVNNDELFINTYLPYVDDETRAMFRTTLATVRKQNEIIASQKSQISEMKPKAVFADAVSSSKNSILVRELAKLLRQNGAEYGERRLYIQMRKDGYICQNSTEPTQRAMEMGLFERIVRTIQRGDQLPLERTTTKVTPKGQIFFINKYLEKGAAYGCA